MTHQATSSSQRSSRGIQSCGKTRLGRSDGSAPASCKEVLEAVIALSQATMPEPGLEPSRCSLSERLGSEHTAQPSGAPSRAAFNASRSGALSAQQRLALMLRNLEPELALKVRTLMVAGRDGQSIHAVKIHITLADGIAGFHAAADDTSENGPLLAEYLRRGHALAQASGLDLERPIAGWANADASGDERDWQRFGRQLAQSQPEDWQCWLVTDEAPEHGSRLYLQHPEHGSWSFHARLDRTEPVAPDAVRRGSNGNDVSTRSLGALIPRLRKAQGVALRRAARAICARVGAAPHP